MMKNPEIKIKNRRIGLEYMPLVLAEIGINHEGSLEKAILMVDAAAEAGCECAKFQCHVIDDEMIPNDVIPGNAKESIWDIMERCALSEEEDLYLKNYVEKKNMIYLSTPFSRAAAVRLEKMGVCAFKIGSGECNNYPLIKHIARYGKPIILSTGMNDLSTIKTAVEIFREYKVPYALMHCTSMYPTPYDKVRLGAITQMADTFADAVIGLSDHSIGNYACFASVALGASILEKHFTCNKSWPGPDTPISIDQPELKDLIGGANAVKLALGGDKEILTEEQPTIDFAYACVVAIRDISEGEVMTMDNIWVKRPGTGQIKAESFESLLGKKLKSSILKNEQIRWEQIAQ
jgi:sialic acid synthase SpsE